MRGFLEGIFAILVFIAMFAAISWEDYLHEKRNKGKVPDNNGL